MTDDPLKQFENELQCFHPLGVSHQAVDQIARVLNAPTTSIADRVLWSLMSAAGMAACLIVALLVYRVVPNTVANPPTSADAAPQTPTISNPQPLLARVDWH